MSNDCVNNKSDSELENMFSSLSEREATVVMYRFGFVNDKSFTLDEIGKMMGVTRERIRQIEFKAVRKMKKKAINSNMKLFDYVGN